MARLREAGTPADEALLRELRAIAQPIHDQAASASALADRLGGRRVVMLGEASHGTHEFYEFRAEVTKALIERHGFRFVAVEGDWPPCMKLNRWCQGIERGSARQALGAFERWPTWMWANEEMIEFAGWLKSYNEGKAVSARTGFYGLDVYSFFESAEAALAQAERLSPALAKRMRERYACLDPFSRDERAYAKALIRFPEGCQEQIAENLQDLLTQRLSPADAESEAFFDAVQNARIAANAETYYRTMMHGSEDSWNVRDRHMLGTLEVLQDRYGHGAKAVVWAHNTHVGDYLATDMPRYGQVNLGGLAREAFGQSEVALVGFGTFEGKVIASPAWDGPVTLLDIPKARPGSMERAMHLTAAALGAAAFWLDLGDEETQAGPLSECRGHRAIGVVYQPEHEGHGNYVPTSLSRRYDFFVHFDRTSGLRALDQAFRIDEFPETWPQGM